MTLAGTLAAASTAAPVESLDVVEGMLSGERDSTRRRARSVGRLVVREDTLLSFASGSLSVSVEGAISTCFLS
jgi:hypothetical protein